VVFLARKSQSFAKAITKVRVQRISVGLLEMIQVRHRSHATYSRPTRQGPEGATVTGSCVCSEPPVLAYFPIFPDSEPTFKLPLQLFAQESSPVSIS